MILHQFIVIPERLLSFFYFGNYQKFIFDHEKGLSWGHISLGNNIGSDQKYYYVCMYKFLSTLIYSEENNQTYLKSSKTHYTLKKS